MKQLEQMRRICLPVKQQAKGREKAMTVSEICQTVSTHELALSQDQVLRLMQFVVRQRQGFCAVDNKFYYDPGAASRL